MDYPLGLRSQGPEFESPSRRFSCEQHGEHRVACASHREQSATLGEYNSVWLVPWESHRVENTAEETAVGLDVFVPGRSFDFWTDRE